MIANLLHPSQPLGEGGFGAQVRKTMDDRADHLVDAGLARRQDQRIVFDRNLLATLRQRDLEALGERLSTELNLRAQKSTAGDQIVGVYRKRFTLALGRFAMIDDGLGFKLVPWSPSLEMHVGKHVSGIAQTNGSVDWGLGKNRRLGL
ncbi:DUF3363 domain-containing protein [Mesorhizobium cantuariense]|uniref:DUF3363 domain-containing protein n=1 Tax=Mesorhizobium cantuariense TaxID=1300275 RepID=A0ABV7MHD6_9HYPH